MNIIDHAINNIKANGEVTVENLVSSYARNKIEKDRLLEEYDYDEGRLYENTDYGYIDGYVTAMERWFSFIGISTESQYVKNIMNKERKKANE